MKLAQIREELRELLPGKALSNDKWIAWKRLIGIPKGVRSCTHEQWVLLCAIVAFKRSRRRVTLPALRVFARNHANDPIAFLPGYLPVSSLSVLPHTVLGAEMAEIIHARTGYRPSESTLRRWNRRLGYGRFSLNSEFSASQIRQFIHLYLKIRREEIERGKRNMETISHRRQAA
ncbi:MAG TPA: hypothetical protein V6D10_20585 [Trichocoleus sp.]|jgi:hypothetical protein